AATTAAPATTTATTEAAAPAATTATTSARTLARFADAQGAAVELATVQRRDGGVSIGLRGHFDERESARLSGHAVRDDRHFLDIASVGGERSAQRFVIGVVREIADVEPRTHA